MKTKNVLNNGFFIPIKRKLNVLEFYKFISLDL